MTIPDRDALRRKLNSLGTAEVGTRLESGAYAANKVPIVHAWLAEQVGSEASEKPKTLVEQYLERLKNHRGIALLVVAATVVVGVAQFTDAVSKLVTTFPGIFRTTVLLAAIPGGSGWLLVGDLNPEGTRYIREPLDAIEKSLYTDTFLIPRKGELLRLRADRDVILAGYKSVGLAKQCMPLAALPK